MLVIGIDVGSVRRKGGFSWATADGRNRGSDDPSALGALVAETLDAGHRIAIAFECPLAVPVPDVVGESWKDLGRARAGEGNRSWSAGAGTGALATGLVQLTWLCRYVTHHCTRTPGVTTRLDRFAASEADLLIAEAMVTSEGKPEAVDGLQDHADALAAARRLDEILRETAADGQAPSEVRCEPHVPLNLAAVAALHAGLNVHHSELQQDILVAKVHPVTG